MDVNTMIGQKAPPFTLRDGDGKPYTVAPGRGRPLVVISHMGFY
jgi:peroxiredoxin